MLRSLAPVQGHRGREINAMLALKRNHLPYSSRKEARRRPRRLTSGPKASCVSGSRTIKGNDAYRHYAGIFGATPGSGRPGHPVNHAVGRGKKGQFGRRPNAGKGPDGRLRSPVHKFRRPACPAVVARLLDPAFATRWHLSNGSGRAMIRSCRRPSRSIPTASSSV